jgi:Mn2+/Fe2+ NRAMP family transporter
LRTRCLCSRFTPASDLRAILQIRSRLWLIWSLFAYAITAFVVHIPWAHVLKATVIPSISFNSDYRMALIAVLGTTISPYPFFWQTSQEVEEVRGNAHALQPLAGHFAFLLFALGIVGTGMLAIRMLAGSAAYAVSEPSAGEPAWKANRIGQANFIQ